MGKKKKKNFWTRYCIYVLILAVIIALAGLYVRGVMVDYEESVPENFVKKLAEELSDEKSLLGKYLQENCFGENAPSAEYGDPVARWHNLCERSKSGKLEVRKSSLRKDETHPIYNISEDGKPMLTICLEETSRKNKLGILTLSEWDIEYCIVRSESSPANNITVGDDNTLSYTVLIPEGHRLFINGIEADLSSAEAGDLDDFKYLKSYTEVPRLLTYSMENLTFEPDFTAKNNAGEEAEITRKNGGVYEVSVSYASTDEAKALADSTGYNFIEIGRTWSKFMTNDVSGSRRGLYNVQAQCYLLPNSDIWNSAAAWAGSVDITFTSVHTIDSWTNEKVTNFIKYSDQFFSCDVYLEKNMTLKTGAKRTDVFNNRLYFVYNTDSSVASKGWYLAEKMDLTTK